MCFVPANLILICAAPAVGQGPSVDQIMTRVAENQAHTQELRRTFAYHQKIEVRLHRGNGKIARQETLEYLVTPTADGVDKKLTHFEGKYESKGRLVSYDQPGHKYKNANWDGDFIKGMVNDLTGDKESKDGIGRDLFPLTAGEQEKYLFTLEGEQVYRGRKV